MDAWSPGRDGATIFQTNQARVILNPDGSVKTAMPFLPRSKGSEWVPEGGINPFGPNDFRPFCKDHDECYGTCGADNGKCDEALGAGIGGPIGDLYETAVWW